METINWSFYLETIEKYYRDLVQKLHKKSATILLRKESKINGKNVYQSTQHNCENRSTLNQERVTK